jgi:hypothetical protein
MAAVGEGATQLQHQPRLPRPRFAHHAHRLTVAGSDLPERVAERGQLALPSHETAQHAPGAGVQRRAAPPAPGQRVDDQRLASPANGHGPARLQQRIALDEPRGGIAQENASGLGGLLQPRREVGGVSHRGVVHAQVVADGAHHHEAGVQPHPERELHLFA